MPERYTVPVGEELGVLWWNLGDLNPAPLVCQTSALPDELRPHVETREGIEPSTVGLQPTFLPEIRVIAGPHPGVVGR